MLTLLPSVYRNPRSYLRRGIRRWPSSGRCLHRRRNLALVFLRQLAYRRLRSRRYPHFLRTSKSSEASTSFNEGEIPPARPRRRLHLHGSHRLPNPRAAMGRHNEALAQRRRHRHAGWLRTHHHRVHRERMVDGRARTHGSAPDEAEDTHPHVAERPLQRGKLLHPDLLPARKYTDGQRDSQT